MECQICTLASNVVLTIPGNVIDENYSLLLLEHADIDLTTAVLLDREQKGRPISDNAIRKLRKEGLIEGRKPHLYVSKQIAKATSKEIEYTLKKDAIVSPVRCKWEPAL